MKRSVQQMVSILVLITFIISSCDKHIKRETKFPDGQSSEVFYVIETQEGNFVKDGGYKTWYKGGGRKFEGHYVNGKKEGNWKQWYENGQMQSDTNFKSDSFEGSYVEWYNNGQKKIEGVRSSNAFVGTTTSWHENGQLWAKVSFDKHGKNIGDYLTWYDNGKKHVEANFVNGAPDGVNKSWDSQGKLVVKREFKNGNDLNLPGTYKLTSSVSTFLELRNDGSYMMFSENPRRTWQDDKFEIGQNEKGPILKLGQNLIPLLKFNRDSILWQNPVGISLWLKIK